MVVLESRRGEHEISVQEDPYIAQFLDIIRIRNEGGDTTMISFLSGVCVCVCRDMLSSWINLKLACMKCHCRKRRDWSLCLS